MTRFIPALRQNLKGKQMMKNSNKRTETEGYEFTEMNQAVQGSLMPKTGNAQGAAITMF